VRCVLHSCALGYLSLLLLRVLLLLRALLQHQVLPSAAQMRELPPNV
jgi:hypothetical protein